MSRRTVIRAATNASTAARPASSTVAAATGEGATRFAENGYLGLVQVFGLDAEQILDGLAEGGVAGQPRVG
jgi:hypothetical protein